ncbi:MAG: DUF3035 domain-containing protein [Acetobacteraceae bacterium]
MTRPSRLRPLRLLPALALAGSLAGCGGGLSRTFGFSRHSPDEFAVTTQPPLSMPPDYAIRAPQPGAPRPQTVSATAAAAAALGGGGGSQAAANSPGQQALLAAASKAAATAPGPQVVPPPPASGISFAKRLLFGGPDIANTQLVNAPAEAARLRHNAALGESATAGPTPTIRPASGGLLSHLF